MSTQYVMTYWIRGGNDVSAQYYDLSNAMVDAIADMLPALREQARQRAFEAARMKLKAAKEKVAKLVADCAKRR